MKYILDTNICIYIIKQKPLIVLDRFKKYQPGEIGISSITSAELQYGVSKSKNFNKNQIALHQFLIPLEIIDFDYNASVEYGKIRYELEKVGTPIGPLDLKRQGDFFCFYQYYVPNGTVPE